MGPDVATVARAFFEMSGEAAVPEGPGRKPRMAIPAGWVRDLDADTERAWTLVSRGVPEIEFVDHGVLFRNGLTILLFEAAAYHRRWATEHPEKYGADVLELIRRGFEVQDTTYREVLASAAELRHAARAALAEVDALLVPATAIVAPPLNYGSEVREQLTRFSRPFNMTGQPVVVLPAPASGLPVGIQVVGRSNAGALEAAAWLEAEWRELAS
jgi:Asp-tRNA(Asn)/Glu-tRNA(Gln) amidotransferase A subunit family amidase